MKNIKPICSTNGGIHIMVILDKPYIAYSKEAGPIPMGHNPKLFWLVSLMHKPSIHYRASS